MPYAENLEALALPTKDEIISAVKKVIIKINAIRSEPSSLSPTMEEGKIVKWVKKDEHVLSGEVLFEVETDKATMEYESPEDGYIAEIFIDEGSTAKVNQLIALISDNKDYSSKDIDEFVSSEKSSNFVSVDSNNIELDPQNTVDDKKELPKSIPITPLAKKYAQNNNINIENISLL